MSKYLEKINFLYLDIQNEIIQMHKGTFSPDLNGLEVHTGIGNPHGQLYILNFFRHKSFNAMVRIWNS
jgi:hypothetical protein